MSFPPNPMNLELDETSQKYPDTLNILDEKKVQLCGKEYIVYVKEVPTKIESGGKAIRKAIKAYVRRV